MTLLTDILIKNSEIEYKKFSKKLTPDTHYPMLGVRVPVIKSIARKHCSNEVVVKTFLAERHTYFEEFLLHGLFIASLKNNVNSLLIETEKFLPFIDNWAICDTFCAALKIVKINRESFFINIKKWLKSPYPYTVRVALVLLLFHYDNGEWTDKIIDLTKDVHSEHYYVNMALAWLYSVLLVKDYDKTIKLIESKALPRFVHNKTIQKARESFRIDQKKKDYLIKMKI